MSEGTKDVLMVLAVLAVSALIIWAFLWLGKAL